MKKVLLAAAVLGAMFAQSAQAEEGPWLVRARGVYISTADKSDAITAPAIPKDGVTINNKLIPEVDFSYFVNEYLAAELILTYPQKHHVSAKGVGQLGDFSHLPPCLTIQGHYPLGIVNPYVGVGVNLTLFTENKVDDVLPLKLDSASVGFVAQVGADVKVVDNVYVNADVKWVTLGTDVKAGDAKVTHVTVNPFLFGLGVGYRF